MSDTEYTQSSFTGPVERVKEILQRLANQYDFDHITLTCSGGTDSVVAADVFARYGPEFGFEPDSITHINTGPAVPQSRLVAKTVAKIHDLEYIEQGYRNEQDSIAARILEEGWPGDYGGSPVTGGHGLEWANRKHKPMEEVYVNIDGFQCWVSGARRLESKKRQGNVPDGGIEKDKPRRVWCSIISGWTSAEKQKYIRERGLPVSEAYQVLGFSGECVACAHDNAGLITDLDLLAPELAFVIRSLAVWLFMRVKRGDVNLAPKRLMWGWDHRDNPSENAEQEQIHDVAQSMIGCSEDNCKTMEDRPSWVLELPQDQIIDRSDVTKYWQSGEMPERFCI